MLTVQRTIAILLPDNPDLRQTLEAFRSVQNTLSPVCFNAGEPMNAMRLHHEQYENVRGALNSQMTCTAIRLVAGTYVSQERNYKRRLRQEAHCKARCERKGGTYQPRLLKEPGVCVFRNSSALFLVGSRGRDADFRKDGTLSLSGQSQDASISPTRFLGALSTAPEALSTALVTGDEGKPLPLGSGS